MDIKLWECEMNNITSTFYPDNPEVIAVTLAYSSRMPLARAETASRHISLNPADSQLIL